MDDAHTGETGNVCEHLVQVEVHLRESLLHVLDMGSGISNQIVPMAKVTS